MERNDENHLFEKKKKEKKKKMLIVSFNECEKKKKRLQEIIVLTEASGGKVRREAVKNFQSFRENQRKRNKRKRGENDSIVSRRKGQ